MVTKTVLNGTQTVLTTTYTYYDPTNTTTSTQIKTIQQAADNYSITYTYTYDGNGNILTISDGVNTYRYAYDELNQLTREDDPIAGISRTYGYRPGGALGLEFECPYTDGEVPMDQAKAFYSRDESWGDLFIGVNGMSASYDSIGNMLSFGEYLYHWEHGRELSAITDRDTMWAFTYDANGMRLRQWNIQGNDYYYVYNGSQLAQMTRNGEVVDFFYDGEGRPAYFTYNNATYYYVTNLQGDVIAILDSTGTMVVNYHYDAYGVLLQTGGTMASTLGTLNPLTYRGYVYDHDTGLYYLQSRYYNPAIRQFISADAYISTGQGYLGYNMFAYCGNNPVIRKDSEGNFWLVSVGIGLLTQYVSDVIENVADGKTGFDVFVPNSSVGEYVAAGVTALIPGKGVSGALVRNVVAEGITVIEDTIMGKEVDVVDSLINIAAGTALDTTFERYADETIERLDSKKPKNYSSYAYAARQSNPTLSREQIYRSMQRSIRFNRIASKMVSFMYDVARNLLPY